MSKQMKPLLMQYDQLLRADADTLPTPKMRGYWADKLTLSLNAGYATTFADAKLALLATENGLVWDGLRNVGATYYGPSHGVLHLLELTMAVGVVVRSYLFGPGTGCQLPPRLRPKDMDCEWGSGLWQGVTLLYSQQIAANHMSGSGFPLNFETGAVFDVGSGDVLNICDVKMLHVYHGRERFSKLALIDGEYENFDMSELDLRNTRDLMTYMALTANGIGSNGQVALERVGGDISVLCD